MWILERSTLITNRLIKTLKISVQIRLLNIERIAHGIFDLYTEMVQR